MKHGVMHTSSADGIRLKIDFVNSVASSRVEFAQRWMGGWLCLRLPLIVSFHLKKVNENDHTRHVITAVGVLCVSGFFVLFWLPSHSLEQSHPCSELGHPYGILRHPTSSTDSLRTLVLLRAFLKSTQ